MVEGNHSSFATELWGLERAAEVVKALEIAWSLRRTEVDATTKVQEVDHFGSSRVP